MASVMVIERLGSVGLCLKRDYDSVPSDLRADSLTIYLSMLLWMAGGATA